MIELWTIFCLVWYFWLFLLPFRTETDVSRRPSTWITNYVIWITAVNIWPNTASAKFIILYWSNFYGATKLDSWQWCSPFLTSQISPSNNLLIMQSYCWISTPYERLVWDYKKADIESIKRALILTNWDHLFLKKDVHQEVKILTDTLFNVFKLYTKQGSHFWWQGSTMDDWICKIYDTVMR